MKTVSQPPNPPEGSSLKASPIKIYYLAALLILIFIAVANYIGLRQIHLQQNVNTVLINVSGHQRTLAVNIMLVANLLVQEPDSSAQGTLQVQLADLIAQMQAEQRHLINGTLPGNLSYPLSPAMKATYSDAPSTLEQKVQDYLLWASRLSTAPASDLTVNNPDYAALLNAWPEMLKELDNAVTQYSLEISAQAAQANQQEIFFVLAVFGSGGIIIYLIFLTMQRSAQSDQLKLLNEIDTQREAHQLLMRNEMLYRLLARNLPNTAVLLFDQDMRYLIVEGAIMGEAGYTKDMMEGKTIYEVLSPAATQGLIAYYQAALKGLESDFEFTSPQGLTYQIHSVPIKADEDRIMGGMLTIQDVTERKRAEEKLREREHFIAQITATVPDVIYIYDLREQRNIFTNRPLGELIGYNKEQIQAMGSQLLPSVMHPDDLARYAEHVNRLSQSAEGTAIEFEYRMKTSNDEWRWFNSAETVFARDEHGSLTQILGVARDIDQRKHTEEDLQRREHIIQQIAATVPDIIYIYDFDLHRNIYANRPFGEAIGYDPDTIRAMGDDFMINTMHPDDWPNFAAHFSRLMQAADNTVIEFEYRMRTPEGTWCWLNSRDIVFTRDADGRVTQILGVARDITEWKIAQNALLESEARFRQIAETVRSAFWIIPVDGRELFYVSPAYEAIWGQSLAEIYANPLVFMEAIHPEDRERVVRERSKNLAAGTYNIEYRIIRPDGGIRWINSRAYPVVNSEGIVERIIGISDDITERKELEKQAFAIAVEREHVRVLSRFIQDTSHDLRTPLTIMTTSLYLLRKLTDPQKQAERIDQIEKQMNHLNRIIGDLHEMSKLDIVEELQISRMDVNRMVKDLNSEYQNILFKKDQTLELNLAENLPIIHADGEQIKHALSNIIDNAVLYTEVGGTITIATSRDDAHVIVAIGDTGIGIAPEHQEHIFDRFYKVDAARTSGRGGPGLGLSMVKRIVEMHGGRVKVESSLGKGSLFQIYLPVPPALNG